LENTPAKNGGELRPTADKMHTCQLTVGYGKVDRLKAFIHLTVSQVATRGGQWPAVEEVFVLLEAAEVAPPAVGHLRAHI
jgi:hypothetical protein